MTSQLIDSRESHMKRVIQLALPMAITQLIAMGSGFLCMTMLATLGHTVLAASALIFSINMVILIGCASILFSLSVLIGHAVGGKHFLQAGELLQQGWMLAVILTLPVLLLFWYIYPILIHLGQDKTISFVVKDFFHANMLRVLPFFISVCNQQICYATQKQKIDMIGNILGVVVLLASAYVLILGHYGFPHLGVAGFAYALTIQGWFYAIFTTLCLYFIPDFKKFELFQFRAHKKLEHFEKII